MRRATIAVTRITPKTRWIFVTVEWASGLQGVGEATASGREAAVVAAFQRIAPRLLGQTSSSLPRLLAECPLGDLPEAAVVSSLDQTGWDLVSKRQGRRLADVLATATGSEANHGRIGLYANINRRTLDRSSEGFAASARAAIAAGYEAIKIAPFDEATPEARRNGSLAEAMEAGVARIRSVRSAIGPTRRLMVDCHWRLDTPATRRLIDIAAELGLYWIECPLAETPAHLDELCVLRTQANARGIKLAGCEEMIRREGFAPFLAAGAYDVIMPDVKYVGGLREMLALADVAARRGVQVSPHNPSGPVCHAMSLHVCAAMRGADLLERQFDETPLFDALQVPRLPVVAHGATALPAPPGLGLSLHSETLARVTELHWSCAEDKQ